MMPSREQVLEHLREGQSFEALGRRLGIAPGAVYMIATGIPADGSDSLSAHELARDFVPPTSQHLVGTPLHRPDNARTRAWIVERAAADRAMQRAAGRTYEHAS